MVDVPSGADTLLGEVPLDVGRARPDEAGRAERGGEESGLPPALAPAGLAPAGLAPAGLAPAGLAPAAAELDRAAAAMLAAEPGS